MSRFSDLGKARGVATHLLEAVHTSNNVHGHWPRRRLTQILGALDGKTIAVWGLTYKPGTDTLRRSSAVELCRWLIAQGATVRTHDPAVRRLPTDLDETVRLIDDPLAAADDAAALVVATNWPAYRDIDASQVADRMSGNLILDANGFLAASLGRASSFALPASGDTDRMTRPLEGRAALITGANQGLGLAIARAYVNAGASVMLCARDAGMLERARAEVATGSTAGAARHCAGGRRVESRRRRTVGRACARGEFPDLQILVNNAGVYGPMGPSETVDWDAWVARSRSTCSVGPDVPRAAAAFQAAPVRQDRPAVRRRRDQPAAAA